jgi:SAM-dependent methyltransferase
VIKSLPAEDFIFCFAPDDVFEGAQIVASSSGRKSERRFGGFGMNFTAKFVSRVNRLWRFLRRLPENWYWLEEALNQKKAVVTFLEQKRSSEAAMSVWHREFDQFAAMASVTERLPVPKGDVNAQLSDRTETTPIDRHYTYHPAWAARVLAKTRPAKHVDISSILHFSSLISAFVPIEFYDIRPAPLHLDGLHVGAADLNNLPFENDSISSLSCMHVLEHVGLGRYGDPLDPDGDLKAISQLIRVLAPGGDLLVAAPVGHPRVVFNAHRVYDHEAFARYFLPLELIEFALIKEHGSGALNGSDGLIYNPPAELVREQDYGCGCFWFRKSSAPAIY